MLPELHNSFLLMFSHDLVSTLKSSLIEDHSLPLPLLKNLPTSSNMMLLSPLLTTHKPTEKQNG